MNGLETEDRETDEYAARGSLVLLGGVLGFFGVLCLLGAIHYSYKQVLSRDFGSLLAGTIFLLISIVAVAKARMLIIGKRIDGGLFAPAGLRVSSLVFLFLSGFAIYVSFRDGHPASGIKAASTWLSTFVGLNALAFARGRKKEADGRAVLEKAAR